MHELNEGDRSVSINSGSLSDNDDDEDEFDFDEYREQNRLKTLVDF